MAERIHGGIDAEALRARGIAPESVVDFSVNLNPYGPCASVIAAARAADLASYPDAEARAARGAWAAALGRSRAEVAVGHGAADLLWAVARALLSPSDRVVLAEPTFSELRYAAAAMGAQVQQAFTPAADFAIDLDTLARTARTARTARLVYLCSPNNPTGEHLAIARIRAFAEAVAPTYVVLDQSFVALSDHADDARAPLPENVIRVRSLTKEFGCPGLRIGVLTAPAPLVGRIEAVRPTWATSAPALAALVASADAAGFVAESWQCMRRDRDETRALLAAHGLAPHPSATCYQLVRAPGTAAAFADALLRHGVLVRDCSSFGLPSHVRIAALPAPARARLATALDVVVPAR